MPLAKRFALWLWASIPACITLLLLLLVLAPKHIEGLAQFMPLLHICAIFFWAVHHARHMPLWFAFIIGLVFDSFSGQPLGFSSLLLLSLLLVVHNQHKYIHKEGFIVQWGMFGLVLGGLSAMQWLIMCFYHAHWISPIFAIVQWLLTLGCYPVLHHWFHAIDRQVQYHRYQLLHSG